MDEWYSLYKGGSGEIEEKKSRFIANIAVVNSVQEANDFIASVKKKYWDARHNCSAFVIGDDGANTRCSDDGEPSGTAGRPMLEVLIGEKITNICVVVTRYFGGTLLGTGGLVRAYQGAVKEGLKYCSVLKKIRGIRAIAECDYTDIGKLQFLATQKGYYIDDTQYGEKVTMALVLEEDRIDELTTDMMDATSGKAVLDCSKSIIYAMIDGKPMIFDV